MGNKASSAPSTPEVRLEPRRSSTRRSLEGGMGNKSSSAPSTPEVRSLAPRRSSTRRSSDYRSHTTEPPNLEVRRWSSMSSTRGASVRPKRLSPRHRNLIIKSWSRIGKLKIVKDTFCELFKTNEEIRSKFPFGDVPLKRLRLEERFVLHCERFLAALDHVIAHLDQIDTVIENAETLGRKHSELVQGLRPEHWQILADTLVERIIGSDTKQLSGGSEVRTAWRMLGQMLVFHMRVGYDGEVLRAARHSRMRAVARSSLDSDTQLYLRARSPIPQRGSFQHPAFRVTFDGV